MLLVDNAVCSFGFQLDNGVPLVPYYHDPEDQELVHLASYLLTLSASNMLVQNSRAFRLRELQQGDLS
jgi:CTD small phosphatase-like protein 2